MSNSLWLHDMQYARPPCPSQNPGVYPNSCPLSWWCHPTISSSVVPLSFCSQSFPASGSFQMSQLFAWGGQSIGVSASTSVFPMNTQDWSPLGWTGWISLQSKRLFKSLLQHHSSKASILRRSAFFTVQLSQAVVREPEKQKKKKNKNPKPMRTQLPPKGCEQRTEVEVVRMCEFDRRALAGLRCRQPVRGELASPQKLWGWQSWASADSRKVQKRAGHGNQPPLRRQAFSRGHAPASAGV